MGVLRFVIRTAVLWVVSLVAAFAGMEAAHRFVIARERDSAAAMASRTAPGSPTADLLCALPTSTVCLAR